MMVRYLGHCFYQLPPVESEAAEIILSNACVSPLTLSTSSLATHFLRRIHWTGGAGGGSRFFSTHLPFSVTRLLNDSYFSTLRSSVSAL